jgi:glycosyltransferase involved in cell wall biosynthesis
MVSGVAVSVERLARAMAKRGHQVSILTPSSNTRFFIEERCGYTIYRVPSWRNPWRKGFRLTLYSRNFAREVMQRTDPELVHLHDPAGLALTILRLMDKSKAKIILTNHFGLDYIFQYLPGLPLTKPPVKFVFKQYLAWVYNRVDFLTVPSNTLALALKELHLKPPIKIISNGVDTGRFSPDLKADYILDELSIPKGKPIILYVGRMDPEKNLSLLFRSLENLKNQLDFVLVMVGYGNDWESLHHCNFSDRIVWIKTIDYHSNLLPALYARSDVFCLPSLYETESMVTMEAMASGLPILASNAGALPELVENGVNGFLLDPLNQADWQTHLEIILKDKVLRHKMGASSLQIIQSRSLEKSITKMANLYRDLLAYV